MAIAMALKVSCITTAKREKYLAVEPGKFIALHSDRSHYNCHPAEEEGRSKDRCHIAILGRGKRGENVEPIWEQMLLLPPVPCL